MPTIWIRSWLLGLMGLLTLTVTFGQNGSRADGVGPGGNYYPIHDFSDDFQVYDERVRAYVPYIGELHADQTALSAYIDLESNRHYTLLISTKQDGYLFINAALKRKLRANQWQVLSIDSLYRAYRPATPGRAASNATQNQPGVVSGPTWPGLTWPGEIFLTIYGAPGLADKQVLIGYPRSATQKAVVLRDDNLSVKPRPLSAYTNFFGFGLLFLLATHAFLFTYYHRAFLRFYSLRDLLSVRAQEESFLINRPLSSTNILFTLNTGFVIGYLIVFVQSQNLDVFASRTLLPADQRLGVLLSEFLGLSGVAFISLLGKYVALEIFGGLYKLQRVIYVHYFKILQSSMLFFTAFAVILSAIAFNLPRTAWSESALLIPLIIFYTARLGLLYVAIRSMESIKNLYLFSYLCIVELIPLIIGLRFVL